MRRIFSGIQPSGNLTLGNYLGAIKNWIPLQSEGEALFCIVDLHAITVPQDPLMLKSRTLEVAATYLASGIDPRKSLVFVQSHVSQHAELAWILSCLTPLGWLNRMTQFKDKAGKQREQAALGLYSYPVLQAADILVYQTTHVPVGEDQKQHLELARDIAGAFNRAYNCDFFILPEPQILGVAPRVMSLRDGTKKMSKSDPSDLSRINMMDSDDEINQKIRKAKTDPEPLPESLEELSGRPEAQNLVTIYAALAGCSVEKILQEFKGSLFSIFKPKLAALAISTLGPIRQETNKWLQDKSELEAILKVGQEKATTKARATLKEVHRLIGFLP
ncbi:MAG: tryptophan--tRNA ligase [Candidatus Paracaedimonas acanthamoebae]|uniref:Tryptophan--tRNA ligase n=1 Tax=Candidatus Paracaedimonas acanthamoebae TaxID=244581 RepID=A0A8J7TU06_9PROT|nr:tryptophan--tRNA ligase [Candidatus Paracaedimonas acanthamoebae]